MRLTNIKIDKRAVLAAALLFGFLFLLTALIFSYHLELQGSVPVLFAPLVSYHVEFMMVMATLGLAVGAGVFYLMSDKIEAKAGEAQAAGALLLGFLAPEDKAIVEHLLKNGGTASQADISRLDGMSRLKAHRAVLRLEKRGILGVERQGKLNRVKLSPKLMNALS